MYWYWYLKVMYWYWYSYLKVRYWYLYWYLDHWYWYWYWYLFVEYLIQDCCVLSAPLAHPPVCLSLCLPVFPPVSLSVCLSHNH